MISLYDYCVERGDRKLLDQWQAKKNIDITPKTAGSGSGRSVWWRCEKGHEWQASVGDRVRSGYGCPVCAGRRIAAGFNDLATVCPEVAAEWHPTKNGTLTPADVTAGSSRKVWWRCAKGHEWQTDIKSRARLSTDCPYCTGKKVASGFNDLATLRPEVAAEWHDERNAPLRAKDVTVASNKKVWWRCEKGHEYVAAIRSRTSQNSGCPYCASKLLLRGFNDLETLYPTVAGQWHPTLNGSVTPDGIFPATNTKYWWICEEGHIWSATPASRTLKTRRTGCPVCSGNYKRSTLYKPEKPE